MSTRALVLTTIAVALVTMAFFFVLGVSLAIILLFAALAVVIGGLLGAIGDPDEPKLPQQRTRLRGGARREVSQMAGSMSDVRGRIGKEGAERLRGLAARRLARHGVELRDPADKPLVEALLGEVAAAVVSKPAPRSISDLRHTIRTLEHLEATSPRRSPE